MEYVVLFFSWAVYYALHSLLASERVKESVPLTKRSYRLAYSAISVVGLVVLLLMNGSIDDTPLFARKGGVEYLSLILSSVGIIIAHSAFRNIPVTEFLGLKSEKQTPLVVEGIYGYIRHPLYTATLLITLGFFLFDARPATAVSVAATWVYLPIGIYLEERKLLTLFGDEYREYRDRVAAILPFIL